MMAVGGVPDLDSIEQFKENLQEQEDEITALESIFEGDEGRLEILSRAVVPAGEEVFDLQDSPGYMLKIRIPVKKFENKLHVDVFLPLSEESVVNGGHSGKEKFARSDSGHRLIWSFETSYLPPLCLHVTLPPTYPSMDSPSFVLSCDWLSPSQLTCLCQQLDQQWQESTLGGGPGMPVLYTWVDWLQENMLSFLGIEGHLSVSSHSIDEDVDDCRVVIETMVINDIVTNLMRYNRECELQDFLSSDQECGVCMSEMPGRDFYQLSGCGHHACRDCMTAHCQMIVRDGNVQNLRCPSYECKENIPEFMLKEILTKEEFHRYQTLALQKALDTMGDITWCPRCNSAVVQEPEQDLNLAHCLTCFYSFCTNCMEAWHRGTECEYLVAERHSRNEQRRQLALQEEERLQDELAKIHRQKENKMSRLYLDKHASKCPSCNAKIMKTGGCNKVTCTNCGKFMCWRCKKAISGYDHFSESSRCNTFSLHDEEVDNSDMGGRDYFYPVPYVPVQPPQPRRVNEVDQRLKENPELLASAMRCGACKQMNLKEGKQNHLVCWNCKANLCFHCKARITGPVGKHYHGLNTCDQHS